MVSPALWTVEGVWGGPRYTLSLDKKRSAVKAPVIEIRTVLFLRFHVGRYGGCGSLPAVLRPARNELS